MLLSDMTQLYFTIFLSRDVVKHICKIVLVSRGSRQIIFFLDKF